MRNGFASLVALGFVVACSGGSGSSSGTSGAGAGSASAMCQAYCDRQVRCAKNDPNCQTECPRTLERSEGKLSSAYASMFQTCFQGLACTENDDACIANFAAADPAYPNIPEVTACMSRREECSAPPPAGDGGSTTQPTTSFSDDYCLSIAALTPEARTEANACLSQQCALVRDCLIRAGAFNY